MNRYRLDLVVAGALVWVCGGAAASDLKLSASKNLVVPIQQRVEIMAASESRLDSAESDFLQRLVDIENPFAFRKPPEPVVVQRSEPVVVEPEPVIEYTDTQILELVSANFSNQVQGRISRGDTRFIQLKGGNLLRPGDTFPARLPQLGERSYIIRLTEVTADGYQLQLNESRLAVPFSRASASGEAPVQFSN